MRISSGSRLILLMFCLACAGCAPSPSVSNRAVAGTYLVTLSQEQILTAGGGSVLAGIAAGTWQLEFGLDGVSRLSQETTGLGIRLREEGPYAVSGDKLTFGAQGGGEYACSLVGAIGTYNWEVDEGTLTLTAIEDDCDRKYLLIAQPWTRQP